MKNRFNFKTAERKTNSFWGYDFKQTHRFINDRIIYGRVFYPRDGREANPFYFLKDSEFFLECNRGVHYWNRCLLGSSVMHFASLTHVEGLTILMNYGMDITEFLFDPNESIRTAASKIIKGI